MTLIVRYGSLKRYDSEGKEQTIIAIIGAGEGEGDQKTFSDGIASLARGYRRRVKPGYASDGVVHLTRLMTPPDSDYFA